MVLAVETLITASEVSSGHRRTMGHTFLHTLDISQGSQRIATGSFLRQAKHSDVAMTLKENLI
jgi:hypothetical protein